MKRQLRSTVGFTPTISAPFLTALFLMSMVTTSWGQQDPVWSVTLQDDIEWQRLAPTGHLLVSTRGSLLSLDPETGEVLWEREDLRRLTGGEYESGMAGFIPYTPYVIVRKFAGADKTVKHSNMPYYINLVNVATGEDLWTTETLELKEHYGYFLLPEVGGMLIHAKDQDGTKTVFLLQVQSGTILWENAEFFAGGDPFISQEGNRHLQTIARNQRPLFDSDSTMITFMSKRAIKKFNARTGELIWETAVDAKQVPARAYGYAPMLLTEDADIVYAPIDETVSAVSTADGSVIWEEGPELGEKVRYMQLTPGGLLVRAGSIMNLLDPATGQPLWEKDYEERVAQSSLTPQGLVIRGNKRITVLDLATGQSIWEDEFKKLKENKSTNFVIKDDKITVYSDKKLYVINLPDGEYTELAKDLKFEDGEVPRVLQLRDDGYFLRSSNNLMLVSFSGEQVFHTYHKKPGLSLLEKAAGFVIDEGIVEAEGGYGEQAGDEWLREFQRDLNRQRFRPTPTQDAYTYMLTNIETDNEKGPGLVRVNNLDGTTEEQLILGTKKPDYKMASFSFAGSELESRLFFKADKKQIVCYRF